MQLQLAILAFAAAIVVQPLADSDVLEPSVQNEVDHAIAKGEEKVEKRGGGGQWNVSSLEEGAIRCPPNFSTSTSSSSPFPTNGMTRTDIAIRLVSTQKPDGRWLVGTNDVTAAAVEILKAL